MLYPILSNGVMQATPMTPDPRTNKPAPWIDLDEENYLSAQKFSRRPDDGRWVVQDKNDAGVRIVVNPATVLRMAALMGLELRPATEKARILAAQDAVQKAFNATREAAAKVNALEA